MNPKWKVIPVVNEKYSCDGKWIIKQVLEIMIIWWLLQELMLIYYSLSDIDGLFDKILKI